MQLCDGDNGATAECRFHCVSRAIASQISVRTTLTLRQRGGSRRTKWRVKTERAAVTATVDDDIWSPAHARTRPMTSEHALTTARAWTDVQARSGGVAGNKTTPAGRKLAVICCSNLCLVCGTRYRSVGDGCCCWLWPYQACQSRDVMTGLQLYMTVSAVTPKKQLKCLHGLHLHFHPLRGQRESDHITMQVGSREMFIVPTL